MAENIDFTEIDQDDIPDDMVFDEEEQKGPQQSGEPLKKPCSAFSLFVQDSRASVREEMAAQGIKATQFLAEASKRWNAMTPSQKQKYVEMAQKLKDAYVKAQSERAALKKVDEDDEEEIPEDELNQMRSKLPFPLTHL
jgi:HMG (high mobility group) box